MTGNSKPSAPARELILDITNTVLVSAASIYEVEYKARRRRVDLPPQELRAALRRNTVEELAITYDHAEYAAHLRWAHRDPWDRLLAAQVFLERYVLVSVNRACVTPRRSTGVGKARAQRSLHDLVADEAGVRTMRPPVPIG